MQMASRIEACSAGLSPGHRGAPHYAGTTKIVNGKPVWTGKIGIASDEVLTAPLRRKKPTTWFVNSMSDLFHENVPDEAIDKVFAVMALTPQHTYQVLTKRSARMRDYINSCCAKLGRQSELRILIDRFEQRPTENVQGRLRVSGTPESGWKPLPNVWLGVSTERQQEADERIPDLLATPAAVRFISAEPLLGPIDLRHIAPSDTGYINALSSSTGPNLDQVIVGGENGERPMHPDWARSLRDQCAAAGTAFFFKQWGSWYPTIDRDRDDPDWRRDYGCANRQPNKYKILNLAGGCGFHGERVHLMQRNNSKSTTGRLLDGVEHNGMPEAASL
jgi:protein gp37